LPIQFHINLFYKNAEIKIAHYFIVNFVTMAPPAFIHVDNNEHWL